MQLRPVVTARARAGGVPFVPWVVLWLLAPVAAGDLFVVDLLKVSFGHVIGRDFSNLWTAGRLALAGDTSWVFNLACFRVHEFDTLGLLANQNYSYPPHALFIAIPFGPMPYHLALALWTTVGVLLFTWSARSFLPKGFPALLPAFTAAGWLNVWDGQYGFIFGALWLLCFASLNARPRIAGLTAGLLTFKPHLGLMIAATVLQRRKALATAVATAIALVAISALAFGPETWRAFIIGTTSVQSHILARPGAQGYFRMMPSAYVGFGRGDIGIGLQLAFSVATVSLLWRHRRWDAFTAATATFLIIPYCFNYDMTVACLGFSIQLWNNWGNLSRIQRAGLMLAFIAPELTFFAPPVVPLALLYAFTVQLRLPTIGPCVEFAREKVLDGIALEGPVQTAAATTY